MSGINLQDRSFFESLAPRIPGAANQAELRSILSDPSSELFHQDLLALGRRLQSRDRIDLAAGLYAWLDRQAETPAEVKQKARRELEALEGRGAFGARAEVLLRQIVQDASNPALILPMTGASIVGSLSKIGALGRLLARPAGGLSRGPAARALAAGIGFGAEGLTFAGLGRALSPAAAEGFGRDLQCSYLSLGAMKLSGWAGRQAWPSRVLGQRLFPQLSMFFGLLLAHQLEARLGLRSETDPNHWLADSLASMLTLQAGARLGHSMLGRRFQRLQAEAGLRLGTVPVENFSRQWATPEGFRVEGISLSLGGKIAPVRGSRTQTLSRQDREFLRSQIADLASPLSLVPEAMRGPLRESLRAALAGEVPVLEAAEALVVAVKHGNFAQAQRGLLDDASGQRIPVIESIKTYRLAEMENPPPIVERFLAAHPSYSGEVSEVLFRRDIPDRIKNKGREINGHDLFGVSYFSVHPELFHAIKLRDRRIERHYPLTFLLWAERQRNGEAGVRIQFTSRISSLEELKALLKKDTRPFVILAKSPAGHDPDLHGPYFLHSAPHNELKSVYHDHYHLDRWNQFGPELRPRIAGEMLRLYDGLEKAVRDVDPALLRRHNVREALDELLSGPPWPGSRTAEDYYGRPFWYLHYHLSKDLSPEQLRKVATGLYRRVKADFRNHPQGNEMLTWMKAHFRESLDLKEGGS